MKQLMARFVVTVLVLAGLGATSSLYAQSTNQVRATIPFNFIVAGRQLPAGTYQFVKDSNSLLVIRNLRQPAGALSQIFTYSGERHDDNNLIFNRYGDRYFLREIHSRSMVGNGEIPRSKLERQAQEASLNPGTTLVAAE
jgi:hypothetical protein